MVNSKYFKFEQYDEKNNNEMSNFTALALGLIKACVCDKDEFNHVLGAANNEHSYLFDNLVGHENQTPERVLIEEQLTQHFRTIPLKSISNKFPYIFENRLISFNDDASYFNFLSAMQTHEKEDDGDPRFDQVTRWIIDQAQGLTPEFYGPAMATYYDFAAKDAVECYCVKGIGTADFFMEDPQAAMNMVDKLYESQCVIFKEKAKLLSLSPQILLNYTGYLQKSSYINSVNTGIFRDEDSFTLKPAIFYERDQVI